MQTMTENKKFLFERDFDEVPMPMPAGNDLPMEMDDDDAAGTVPPVDFPEDAPEPEPEPEEPTFSQAEMDMARAEGFDEGKAEGLQEAEEHASQKLTAAIEKAGQQLTEVMEQHAGLNEAATRDAVTVAAVVLGKLLPDLVAQAAEEQIIDLIEKSVGSMMDKSRLLVKVSPDLAETISQRLEGSMTQAQAHGDILVIGDETMEPGDCRVEWDNGGMERKVSDLYKIVETILAENLGLEENLGRSLDADPVGDANGVEPSQEPALEASANADQSASDEGPTGEVTPVTETTEEQA